MVNPINLLQSPNDFFKSIRKEKFTPAIWYFVAISVISTLIGTISEIIYPTQEIFTGTMVYIFAIFGLLVGSAWSVAMAFVSAGITKLGVKMLKGEISYVDSFKIVTYTSFIGLILSTIFSLIGIFVRNPGVNQTTNPFGIYSPWYWTLLIIGMLAIGIYVIVLEVKGIKQYTGLSTGKAFMSTIIIPLIILGIGIILAVLIGIIVALGVILLAV